MPATADADRRDVGTAGDHEPVVAPADGLDLHERVKLTPVRGKDPAGNPQPAVTAKRQVRAQPAKTADHRRRRHGDYFAFEDMGEQQVKNIARPISAHRIRVAQGVGVPSAFPLRPVTAPQPALALPDKPSVAVLPFTNMSGDPEQEFVSDGIAEDVITALSRYPSLFVIARNSCFT